MGTNDATGLPVRNHRIHVSYDGTGFAGWQVQPEQRTVQGEIERALGTLLGAEVRLHGSGRTDAGVHATGQVAHFRAAARLEPDVIERALHGYLPADIHVFDVSEAPDDFDARRSASQRTYLYRIVRRRDPHRRFQAWEIRYPLDAGAMARAAEHLLGAHDFTAFAASSRKGMDNRIDVRRASWAEEGDELCFTTSADRFVHRFVRNVVGTMVDVGRGETSPEEIPRIIEGRDRTLAGPAAPAHGLYLTHVDYDAPAGRRAAAEEGDSHEVFSRHG